jgi:hypothetical protein
LALEKVEIFELHFLSLWNWNEDWKNMFLPIEQELFAIDNKNGKICMQKIRQCYETWLSCQNNKVQQEQNLHINLAPRKMLLLDFLKHAKCY